MAQKVEITLICDVTEGTAVETVGFAVRGVSYEIDLSEPAVQEFDSALAKFVLNARPMKPRHGKTPGARRGTGKPTISQDPEQNAAVRAWARGQGMPVSERGRISHEVKEAFTLAHSRELAPVG